MPLSEHAEAADVGISLVVVRLAAHYYRSPGMAVNRRTSSRAAENDMCSA